MQACKKRNVVKSFLETRQTVRRACVCPRVVGVSQWSRHQAVAKDLVDCFVAEASERFNCWLSLLLSLQRARGAEAVSSKCVCFPKTQRNSLGSVPNSPFEKSNSAEVKTEQTSGIAVDSTSRHFLEDAVSNASCFSFRSWWNQGRHEVVSFKRVSGKVATDPVWTKDGQGGNGGPSQGDTRWQRRGKGD